MPQPRDAPLAQAVQSNRHVVTPRPLRADIALEPRGHPASPLRGRQSARTDKLPLAPCDFHHHPARQEQPPRLLALFTRDGMAAPRAVRRLGHRGTGQIFWAQCLASAACPANVKGLCPTALARRPPLMAAAADHSLLHTLQPDATPALLVCDEWGDLSLGQQGAPRFCQVLRHRH